MPGIFFFGVIHSVYQISEREKEGGKRKERTTKWRRRRRRRTVREGGEQPSK